MRLPKQQQRLYGRGSVLVGLAIAWLVASGCQGPGLDRLDGSTTRPSTADPIVDNGPPPAHQTTHDTSSSPDANPSAQSAAINQAAIAENLNNGHREAALNHFEQAETCYRNVLNLDPENPVANHRLAVLADRRSDFATSERCYLMALRREPNNPDLLSDLGYSYYLQGRTAEAERFLRSAVRINPQHQLALDNLSLLYAKLGDRERTYEMLKRAVGERDARTRLAQLFPAKSAPAANDDDTFTASFAPFSEREAPAPRPSSASPALTTTAASDQSPSPTGVAASVPESRSAVAIPPTPAPATNSGPPVIETPPAGAPSTSVAAAMPLPPMPSPATAPMPQAAAQSLFEKQLADLMERERQRAVAQRSQQQSLSAPPMPAVGTSAPGQPLAAVPATQPALRPQAESWLAESTRVPTAPPSVPAGHVPDERINDAFSAIDREGSGNSLPSASATENAPRFQPSAPAPWSQSTGPTAATVSPAVSPTVSPAQPVNRTASVPAGTPDWPAIPTDAPNRTNPAPGMPATIPPAPEPDPMSVLARPTTATTPQAATGVSSASPGAASKNGSDPELDPSTPQWQNAMNGNPPEAAPSAATAAPNGVVPAWQPDRSPRIVATQVTPSAGAAPAAPPRTADALDEFEAQLQKNNPGVAAGKSFSNSAVVAKPAAIQPLSHDQQAAPNKPARPTEASAGGVQPWSMRIQPRRDPPALFGPDDAAAPQKKASPDKSNGFETGTSWSDVPQWPGASSSGAASGTSSSSDGPTIRPGQ